MKASGPPSPRRRGFTLIELLIVVAIIAILAAIAVPNFLEAQTRAKISRAKADMRSVATALEAYRIDQNAYPPTPFTTPTILTVIPTRLSTPVAYITTAQLEDPFLMADIRPFQGLNANGVILTYSVELPDPEGADPVAGRRYYYQSLNDGRRGTNARANLAGRIPLFGQWEMASLGPNKLRDFRTPSVFPFYMEIYDPTNGTISTGDIIRSQADSDPKLKP